MRVYNPPLLGIRHQSLCFYSLRHHRVLRRASYPVSAEIVEDAHIALFRREYFDDIACGNADALYALLKLMAKRLRQSQADIHALALHSATARLAAKLLDLAGAFGKVNDIGIEIQLTLNREQLGPSSARPGRRRLAFCVSSNKITNWTDRSLPS